MVALRALKPRAEEYLGGVVHELIRRLQILVPNDRRTLRLIADRAQNLAGELVIGHVRSNGLTNPVVKNKRAIRPVDVVAALDTQNVRPLVGEEEVVLG